MPTSFEIITKLAAIYTNAPPAQATPLPAKQPTVPTPSAAMQPTLKPPGNMNMMSMTKPGMKPGALPGNKPNTQTIPTISNKPATTKPSTKLGLDAQSALLGLGAGIGGFAAGKAFVEPAMTGAAKASPWLIGALAALVVGSIAANEARKDENKKVHLEHMLANLSPAERQILLESGNQAQLQSVGFQPGPPVHPSESMHRSFY